MAPAIVGIVNALRKILLVASCVAPMLLLFLTGLWLLAHAFQSYPLGILTLYPWFLGAFGVAGLIRSLSAIESKSPLLLRLDLALLCMGIVATVIFVILWAGIMPIRNFKTIHPALLLMIAMFPGLPMVMASVEIRRLAPNLKARPLRQWAQLRKVFLLLLVLPIAAGAIRIVVQETAMLWYGHDLVRAAYESADERAKGEPYCVLDYDSANTFDDMDKRKILLQAVRKRMGHPRPGARAKTSPHFGIRVGNEIYWWSFRERRFKWYRPGVWGYLPRTSCTSNVFDPQDSDRVSDALPEIDPAAFSADADSTTAASVFEDWQSNLSTPANLDRRDGFQLDTTLPLAGRYDDLERRSYSGDPNAAMELAVSLSYCAVGPRSFEELTALIDHTYQTRRVSGRIYPVDDVEGTVQSLRQRYGFCVGIDREQTLNHHVHMRIAADNGNIEAKVKLRSYGEMHYDDVFEALDRAWPDETARGEDWLRHTKDAADAGSLEAMYRLGGKLGPDGLATIDKKIEAAALTIAGAHMMKIDGSSTPFYSYSSTMDQTINKLSPQDAASAIALANELIERDGCCFRFKSRSESTTKN